MSDGVQLIENGPVARLVLDKPERHNAFDDALIARLTAIFEAIGDDPATRVLVITGAGASFSAGADLEWMKRAASFSADENHRDAKALAAMLRAFDELPIPSVAMVNGPAVGGGVGLVCCADVAIASERAFFRLTEVRLGLVPAVIAPYVVAAIGRRQARRYMLTAERIEAQEAKRLGLVHETAPREALAGKVDDIVAALLQGGPEALAETKTTAGLAAAEDPASLGAEMAAIIAKRRASDEGREGVAAFLEKREPDWRAS